MIGIVFFLSFFDLADFFIFHVAVEQANTHLYLTALSVASSLHYHFIPCIPDLCVEGGISVWRLLIPLCFWLICCFCWLKSILAWMSLKAD